MVKGSIKIDLPNILFTVSGYVVSSQIYLFLTTLPHHLYKLYVYQYLLYATRQILHNF